MADDCIFCKIATGKIPSKLIYKNDLMIAFDDINPVAPVHSLVVPIEHIARLDEMGDDRSDLLGKLLAAANEVARIKGVDKSGFRVVINNGKDGGQLVPHLHLHVIGGKNLNHKMG